MIHLSCMLVEVFEKKKKKKKKREKEEGKGKRKEERKKKRDLIIILIMSFNTIFFTSALDEMNWWCKRQT